MSDELIRAIERLKYATDNPAVHTQPGERFNRDQALVACADVRLLLAAWNTRAADPDPDSSRAREVQAREVQAREVQAREAQAREAQARADLEAVSGDMEQAQETIREDFRVDYKDYGTVEGRLEAIQDQGGLELRVRDAALRITVKCYVPEDMLAEAFGNFRKRVEVAGLVHYRRNGTPVSIEASAIAPLPDDRDLPSIDDIRGLLRAVG
jgi:hypothetical protein